MLIRIMVLAGMLLVLALGVSGVWRLLRRMTLKTMARTGAVLSFACFSIGGLWMLLLAASDSGKDGWIVAILGLYLLGKAFYSGTKLWLAVEKSNPSQGIQ